MHPGKNNCHKKSKHFALSLRFYFPSSCLSPFKAVNMCFPRTAWGHCLQASIFLGDRGKKKCARITFSHHIVSHWGFLLYLGPTAQFYVPSQPIVSVFIKLSWCGKMCPSLQWMPLLSTASPFACTLHLPTAQHYPISICSQVLPKDQGVTLSSGSLAKAICT